MKSKTRRDLKKKIVYVYKIYIYSNYKYKMFNKIIHIRVF